MANVKFYNSADDNGGVIDTNSEIITGILNNLFNDIIASQAETGLTRYKKFFIKNEDTTDLTSCSISLCLRTESSDSIGIFIGTANDTTSTFDNSKIRGIAKATDELDRGTKRINCEVKNKTLADYFATNDKLTFIDSIKNKQFAGTIASVGSTYLEINEDVPTSYITADSLLGSSITVGTMTAGQEVAVWVQNYLPPLTQYNEANNLEIALYHD